MYTNLTVDKILKVLEDDVFKPRYAPRRPPPGAAAFPPFY